MISLKVNFFDTVRKIFNCINFSFSIVRKSPFLPNRPLKVAILGSSGAVGSELIKILEERDFPISELVLLSSERSEGKIIKWKGEEIVTQKATKKEFLNVDLVLASAGGSISKKWLSTVKDQNALLIDNTFLPLTAT